MSLPLRIMVVDDDRVSRHSTSLQLEKSGLSALPVENPILALKHLEQENWDVVVTDMRMPNMSGIEFLRRIKEAGFDVDVILMTAFASVETAVEAMQCGAADYLVKPFEFAELEIRLRKIQEYRETRSELKTLRTILGDISGRNGLVGTSPRMSQVHDRIEIFAEHDTPVLITGETGTGKELVARAIHETSQCAAGPFVPLACGAIPPDLAESELFGHEKGAYTGAHGRSKGLFERADGGSVLLDDIDDLPLAMQVKLLRVLQEGTIQRVGGTAEITVNARVIATSKVDLAASVSAGAFRDDLFYRLRGLEIQLPPLRERGDDVLLLAQHFLDLHARRDGSQSSSITEEVAEVLRRYEWPGNVRELRRSIESAAILSRGGDIRPDHFPLAMPRSKSSGRSTSALFSLQLGGNERIDFAKLTEEFEQALVLWALERSGGRQNQAAEVLGLPRSTFQSKLGKASRP